MHKNLSEAGFAFTDQLSAGKENVFVTEASIRPHLAKFVTLPNPFRLTY
jgi:hypothetical protein